MTGVWLLFLSVALWSKILWGAEPFFVSFDPPKGWQISDPAKYQEGVKVGFVKSKRKVFSPAITLALEEVGNVDLEKYINAVRSHFEKDPLNAFRDLGTLETKLGKTALLQVDMESRWGTVRLLQAVALYQGYAVIQSAVALRDHFLATQEVILHTFTSTAACPSLAQSCSDSIFQEKLAQLFTGWERLAKGSELERGELFQSSHFQTEQWGPFVSYVKGALGRYGECWQFLAIQYAKERLIKGKGP